MEKGKMQYLPFFLLVIPAVYILIFDLSYLMNIHLTHGLIITPSVLQTLILVTLPLILSLIFLRGLCRRKISIATVIYSLSVIVFMLYLLLINPFILTLDYALIMANVSVLFVGGIIGIKFNPKK